MGITNESEKTPKTRMLHASKPHGKPYQWLLNPCDVAILFLG